ncbi:MAG: DUF885 domain-containing protein, partial [Gammaproteobacteria bacterium]|nr:DUF885 domain-containing protein [Gammaproteobacteria bacterium]
SSAFSASGDAETERQEAATGQALQELAGRFFAWRRIQQPSQADDIPRVERPDGWLPDWSPDAIESYLEQYEQFLQAADALDSEELTVPQQVDLRLLKSAIQRVYWELEVLQSPRRNPLFYVQQTLGSVFELLLISSPMTESRADNIVLRLEHIPKTLRYARSNLDLAVRPFTDAAVDSLAGIEDRLERMETGLKPVFPPALHNRLGKAVSRAGTALERYSTWLEKQKDTTQTAFAIGPFSYQWFLVNVALIPHTPDELLAQGIQASNRAVVWEALEHNRNRDVPQLPVFKTIEQQIRATEHQENEIRKFLEIHELMTVPDSLMHYRNRPFPDYLTPLSFLGVTDDLTSETRLDEDAVRYIAEPAEDLPYFALSAARDPRPLLIHEGIPGHYYQLARSWANPNPIRRRYIDSGINEGIAFYAEEMLLQAGLFNFSPRSREIIYNYARLRALRVEIDIRLAVGDFTIEAAADYLAHFVPMDRETAREEAVFFAFNPGQAISYQVGKSQIIDFLADARREMGDDFSLRDFHDFLMLNGNVPVALQRWEYLGREDFVLRLDALGGKPVTVPQ